MTHSQGREGGREGGRDCSLGDQLHQSALTGLEGGTRYLQVPTDVMWIHGIRKFLVFSAPSPVLQV